jgi:hypothetical protein
MTSEPSLQERYSQAVRDDTGGTFTSIAIHHRPLGAVLAFSREMSRRLGSRIGPGHFDPG